MPRKETLLVMRELVRKRQGIMNRKRSDSGP